MNNEYYGVSTTSSQDFLAHYGVKGMKWGVRKAIASGSDRALRRQYKKASKKLAKLEKLGANGKKYAKRAAAYGAGAAAAGGLAAAGTERIGDAIVGAGNFGLKAGRATGAGMTAVGRGIGAVGRRLPGTVGRGIRRAGIGVSNAGMNLNKAASNDAAFRSVGKAAGAVRTWGASTSISDAARGGLKNAVEKTGNRTVKAAAGQTGARLNGISNNTIARIGAGAVGAGLGIAAGRNAYRAATAKKHAAQAQEFRREMNKAFAGTKYANGMPNKSKKRRK